MSWWDGEYDLTEDEYEAIAREREAEQQARYEANERAREAKFDAELEAYQAAKVWIQESRPREDVLAEFTATQAEADALASYTLRCVICQHKVTGPQYREAVGPGHIYSDAGRREFSMTGLCEWCFDQATDTEEGD